MTTPIVFHGNGGAHKPPKTAYRDIKKWVEDRKFQSTSPKNLMVVTWNDSDKMGDMEYCLSLQGFDKSQIVKLGKDDEWIIANKFLRYDAVADDLYVFGEKNNRWLETGELKDRKKWYNCNKIVYLKRWLDTTDLTGVEYIFVADSFDVLVAAPIEQVIERFNSQDCEIFFNAEFNCFSTKKWIFREDEITRAEGVAVKRYPNTGAYIARTIEFTRWVNWAFAEMHRMYKHEAFCTTDDQYLIHKYYVENYPRVKCDLKQEIFKCLDGDWKETLMPDGSVIKDDNPYMRWSFHGFKLLIGIPMLFPYVHVKFWESFDRLEKPSGHATVRMPGSLTAIARNDLVKIAIENDFSHILFLDSDMVFPPYLIRALAEMNTDIAAAPYQERYWPYRPVLMKQVGGFGEYAIIDPEPARIIKADAVGTGALLIHHDVFAKLEFPWFDYRIGRKASTTANGMNVDGEDKHWTEDMYFCQKAREAGFEILVDSSLQCGHLLNDRIITMRDWDRQKGAK